MLTTVILVTIAFVLGLVVGKKWSGISTISKLKICSPSMAKPATRFITL